MSNGIQKFWAWYERHYKFHLRLSVILFSWQIIHLIWLGVYIIIPRLLHTHPPELPGALSFLLVVVDYTEIPAIISTSLLYVNDLRKKCSGKAFWYLIFLNSQWLHLFWITDEVVAQILLERTLVAIPVWLAWIAILIDYLETPVMYDTIKRWLKYKKFET